MIKLRPWKGSKNEFEVDVIVNGPQGRALRKRVKAPVTGKSSAERWARALEQELLSQLLAPEPAPEKPPAPTFEEFAAIFLDLCRANRLGVNTLMNYEIHLRHYLVPVLGKRRLDQIPPADITRIKSSLSAKSHNTACEVLKTLRRVFNVAIAQKHITGEPVDLEIPRRLRKAVVAYDAVQQAALLTAARELGPFFELVVLLGIDGGLRRDEIVGLHWSDINFGQGFLVVRHNIVRGKLDAPKGRTEDEVALTGRLTAALKAYRHDAGPYVLTNRHGGHFSEQDPTAWMERITRLAGLPWHGTHVLRKTCGTRIADGGGGVAAVAAHLRHKDLQTASRYIDRRGASSRAVNALES
ncbi:MAG: tyrosine-type recombinase/integrase family protein [Myxococcales bacterium]|nr:tyrosine-type recombinase/integrase family protein [Myxococcales bacterium]